MGRFLDWLQEGIREDCQEKAIESYLIAANQEAPRDSKGSPAYRPPIAARERIFPIVFFLG